MNRTREQILPILHHWITFLAYALPLWSVSPWIEQVVGALLNQRGWVTAAYLAIAAPQHWTSYYKWLQQGRWSWLRVGQYLAVLLRCGFPRRSWYLVVDDSINCRTSPQAPSRGQHHPYSRPEVIIQAYARRWPIEPLFNQLRHSWGWLDAW